MRFSMLLFVLFRILKRAAKRKPAYRRFVGNIHQVRIMIKTENGNRGRLFVFDQGTLTSRAGGEHAYDTAIIWSDPATAFKVMSSRNDEAAFLAAAQGKMKVDGMSFFAQWFNDGVKLAMQR
ncbi:MAG: hypothetical protein C4519_24870 [Desulfobacteraceae bacterium]|nr:MAG: hypothetical protein C4519_24870 [Desulfobacteraceae bacterium]